MLSIVLSIVGFASAARPQVVTSSGKVLGNPLPGANEFLGVPFGKPTRKFEPPEDFSGLYPSDPLDASDFALACLQVGDYPGQTYGSEDCLYANVWKPANATPESKLPVLVFINGGANQFGETEPYNGSALAVRQGVVFVSITYRTGPLGWMAFEEDASAGRSTGSFGLLDTQSGLRWVQREVAAFGGDASRVVLHGQSSGAGLVELHLVMPESKGLVWGLVSQSGSLNAAPLSKGFEITKAIGEKNKCQGSLKKCLQGMTGKELTSLTYSYAWAPHADGVAVPDDPMTMLRQGLVNPMNFMLGQNTNDTLRLAPKSPVNKTDYLVQALQKTKGDETMAQQLVDLYPASDDGTANRRSTNIWNSDANLCRTRRRAELVNTALPGKVFMYRFNWWYKSNPSCSSEPNYHDASLGSTHEDEVTFVFGQPIFMYDGTCCGKWGDKLKSEACKQLDRCVSCWNPEFGDGYHAYFNDQEFQFSQLVGGFWAAFAATGTPNGLSPVEAWPVSTDGSITHNVVLDADLPGQHRIERSFFDNPAICDFWDSLEGVDDAGLIV